MVASIEDYGTILLLGGGGFLGTEIIEQLQNTGGWTSIVVANRNPKRKFSDITYKACDITNQKSVEQLLDDVKPRIVLHLVSPHYKAEPKVLHDININGTKNLIAACQRSPAVEALLYTSTIRVIANKPPAKITEDQCTIHDEHSTTTNAYGKTKGMADSMVQSANGESLKTAVLRFPIIYGGRDQHMEIVMDFFDNKQTNTQLGDNAALFEIVSVQNAAHAQVLAARALVTKDHTHNIAGQAFSVTDDHPMHWYDFARKVWTEAGDTTKPKDVKVVPFWLLISMASTWEWTVKIFSLGLKRPEDFNWYNINTLREGNVVLDISKARKLLGYEPIVPTDEAIKRATQRALKERKESRMRR
jgi:sterol-4alpha-carboxylate 3-dehydrogenase (decarboxylating)